jgi:D-arabinan exo alpha-(1,3)/(1,5)-arabinofuranosidase (non-reducing end)
MVGRALVEGLPAIRVRVRFAPFETDLYPGKPFPQESAWSEIRYDCYCYVMPGTA